MDQQQTVVGLFRTPADAHLAAKRLADAGFSREFVDVAARASQSGRAGTSGGDASDYRNSSGTMVEGAADAVGRTADRAGQGLANAAAPDRDPSDYRNSSGTAVEGAADAVGRTGDSFGSFFSSLFGGDDADDTRRYTAATQQPGMSVVTVHCHSAENAHAAAALLDAAGAVDVDEQAAQLGYTGAKSTGWTGARADALTGGTSADGMSAQVIEENLQIGKRTEQTGGARLRSRIVERPVEEHVRLREERVTVERTAVNRAATEADFTAFKEGEMTMTESAERAVVQKEARVVEEVNLRKEVTERDEVVRDTVRSTEVDVEQLSADELRRRETGSTSTDPMTSGR